MPPCSSAVLSGTGQTVLTMRDRYLQTIAERVRMSWQKAIGYDWRALVKADVSRLKWIIGAGLRSCTDRPRVTEVAIAVTALNRTLDLGHTEYVYLP